MDFDKVEDFTLSAADHALLQATDDDTIMFVWHDIGVREGFYPTTVDWPNPKSNFFRARPIEKFHSIEDIDNGWTFNDWSTGWGPGEKWRFTLNRRLNPVESRRVNVRLSQHETWDAETQEYDLDLTLEMIRRLCGDDLKLVRVRKDLIEAVEIVDGWNPIWPEPEDVEISSGK